MFPFLFMKSIKPIKSLEEIVKPFVIKSDRFLECNVNGKRVYVAPGVPTELTYGEYEALYHAGQLED